MRFVHASDIHLDSPMRGLVRYPGAPIEVLREVTRRALARLVELTLDVGAPLLVLAGDLYDGDWQDYGTGLYFQSQMVRLRDSGVRVALVRGNHDAHSRITKSLKLPDNVLEFPTSSPATHILGDLGIAVHGQSYARQREERNLALAYPTPVGGLFNIGVLHTSLDGRPGHEPYAPCRLEELIGRGYDYWALGHVHTHEIVHRSPWVVYSGNLQGRHAREVGPKGACVIDIEGPRVLSVSHHPCDVLRWEQVRIEMEALGSISDFLDHVGTKIDALAGAADGRPLAIRVIATGTTRLGSEMRQCEEGLRADLQARVTEVTHGAGWLERLTVDVTPPAAVASFGPVAALLAILDELSTDSTAVLASIAELNALSRTLSGSGAPSDLQAAERLQRASHRLRAALRDMAPTS